jgi:hypothetical protein
MLRHNTDANITNTFRVSAMDETERSWTAMSPRDVASFLRAYPGRWWIAGGWSLDLFLGHPTRLHEDTDVVILQQDLDHIHTILPGWTIYAADPPGTLRPWLEGETLPEHIHDIWCRPPGSHTWRFQFMVTPADDDRWFFRRDYRISGMIADWDDVRDGIPILAPEVQLLYKARFPNRPKDKADLRRMIPHLTDKRRLWLRDAIELLYPDSPALDML